MELRDWRQFERHPLLVEAGNVEGKAWQDFVANLRAHGFIGRRKIILHDGKVIHGWHLQRACVEANVKPKYEELKLPAGVSIEQYWASLPEYCHIIVEKDALAGTLQALTREYDVPLSTGQDLRRHESQEAVVKRMERRQGTS